MQAMEREFLGVSFSACGSSVSEQQLDNLETLAGVRLPSAYREFLRTVNGGRPRPSGFKLLKDSQEQSELLDDLRAELDELRPSEDAAEIQRRSEDLQFFENVYVPRRVVQLFSVGTGKYDAMESVVQNARIAELHAPFTLLPIGMDDIEQGVAICFEPGFSGHVVVLPEPSGPDELREIEELHEGIVARSFGEFFHRLFPARLVIKEGYVLPERYLNSLGIEENYSE